MLSFGEYKTAARKRLWPSGEASNLVLPHNKMFVDALIELQTFNECLQFDNTQLVPHCSTFFNCGVTVFDAPRGSILGVSVVDVVKASSGQDSSATQTSGALGSTLVSGLLAGTSIGEITFALKIFDPPSDTTEVASVDNAGTYDVEIVGKNTQCQFYKATDPQYYQVQISYTNQSGQSQSQSKNILLRSCNQKEIVQIQAASNSTIYATVSPVNQPYTDGTTTITVTAKVAQSATTVNQNAVSTSLATNQNIDWCSEIHYDNVDYCHIHKYLSTAKRNGCCPNIANYFALYNCGKNRFPPPTDEGLGALPLLPIGFHYAQKSTDAKHRALRGRWAIDRGRIYVAPWIQSTETIIVKWDGIKRTWADADPFSEDPLVQSAIENFVLWHHEEKFNHDYDAAESAKVAFQNDQSLLLRQCDDESRIRNCTSSRARGSKISSQTLFYNEFQTYTARCPSGQSGSDVTISIDAGTVASSISVDDANQKALAEAQSQAKSQLNCLQVFSNATQSFTAHCVGESGAPAPSGSPVTVTIPAGTVTSTVSQADADAKALQQATDQANSQLACVWYNAPQTYTAHCPTGTTGDDVSVTIPSGAYSSTLSQSDADSQAILAAQTQAQSEISCAGATLYWNTAQTANVSIYCAASHCTSTVSVVVAANTFSSLSGQLAANQMAYNFGRSRATALATARCASAQCGAFIVAYP